MDQHDDGKLANELPGHLQRELTRALAATSDAPGLDRYVGWLRSAISRVTADGSAGTAKGVYDEWVETRPRSARRATSSGFRVHV